MTILKNVFLLLLLILLECCKVSNNTGYNLDKISKPYYYDADTRQLLSGMVVSSIPMFLEVVKIKNIGNKVFIKGIITITDGTKVPGISVYTANYDSIKYSRLTLSSITNEKGIFLVTIDLTNRNALAFTLPGMECLLFKVVKSIKNKEEKNATP